MPRYGNGVGRGTGWGGPARGASQSQAEKASSFTSSNQPVEPGARWDRRREREVRTQQLEDMLFALAGRAEREETRVTAAVKLHAIYNGQPVARNITLNTDDVSDLSDEQLRAELERFGDSPASTEAGAASTSVSAKLSDVRH
jgi:hypothetical protein